MWNEEVRMSRLKYIDVAKGIGIILVLIGHILPTNSIVFKIIYSFHMPLFFIISGFLFDKDKYTLKGLVKKKFKIYIIPYFVISFVCLILFGRESIVKYSLGILYSYGNLKYMPNCSPLWFLTCLFLTEIIFIIILKRSTKPYISIGICLLLGVIYNQTVNYHLPWNLDVSLFAIGFMYFGLVIKQYKLLNRYKHKYSIILLIMAYISVEYNSTISLNGRMYGNILLTCISGITISFLVLRYSKYLEGNKVLKFYGENTLFIMGYNYAINTFYFGYLYMFTYKDYSLVVGTNIVIFSGIIVLVKNKLIPKLMKRLSGNKKIYKLANRLAG
jgi:acyltransferase